MAKDKQMTLKRDLTGSIIIGFAAAALSLIVVNNLEIPIPYWSLFVIFPMMTIIGIFVARLLGRKIPVLYKFVKFGEAGGLNWLVDFGVLNLLIMWTGISAGLMYAVFKGTSFIISSANSYGWNKFWVFESKEKETTKELGRFAITTTLGLGVNVAIASLIVWLGPEMFELDPKVWANIAAAVGSIVAMMWNFIMYKIWVFKK